MMNTTKRKMMMALAVAAAISAFAGCGTETEKPAQTQESIADAGASSDSSDKKDAGIFTSMNTTTLDGEKIDSSVFSKNKVTLVNVWNIGCTPCVEEIPTLDKLNKEYEGKGAAILGLYHASPEILEEERKDAEEILTKANAEYPQLTLTQEMYDTEMIQNIMAFPTTYVVDSEGSIVNKIEGSNDYEGWKEFIEEELKKAEANE